MRKNNMVPEPIVMVSTPTSSTLRAFAGIVRIFLAACLVSLGLLKHVIIDLYRTSSWTERWCVFQRVLQTVFPPNFCGWSLWRFLQAGIVETHLQKILQDSPCDFSWQRSDNNSSNNKKAEDRLLVSFSEAARYMRFSTEVYGKEAAVASRLVDRSRGSSDSATVVLFQRKLLHPGGSSHFAPPQYALAVNHSDKAVILGIPGACTLTCLGTYWGGESADFYGGSAHGGLLRITLALWAELRDELVKTLNLLPKDYKLVLTGHSLVR